MPPIDSQGFRLSFDEEFNDLSLWNGTSGTWKTSYYNGDRTLFNNGELQVYADPAYQGTSDHPLGLNPFSIDNGILTVAANPTPAADLPYVGGIPYTSGLLTTEPSFSQLYGYFEIRAQVPYKAGVWPAFWMLPADKSFPTEIDAMEALGQDSHRVYHGSRAADAALDHNQVYNGVDETGGFHVYGVDWEPTGITWYVDGQAIDSAPNVSNTPMYLLTNLAVGGIWSGPPNATSFPAEWKIDYIRAYAGPSTPLPQVGQAAALADVHAPPPAAGLATADPSQHVDSSGWHGGWSPDDLLDTRNYLQHDPDVAAAGLAPPLEPELHGSLQGNDPGPDASTAAPLPDHPDMQFGLTGQPDHHLDQGLADYYPL
jgi:beta-glucanase (GH16 family)